MAVLDNERAGMQVQLDRLQAYADEKGLTINLSKCQAMVFNSRRPQVPFQLGGGGQSTRRGP